MTRLSEGGIRSFLKQLANNGSWGDSTSGREDSPSISWNLGRFLRLGCQRSVCRQESVAPDRDDRNLAWRS